MPQLVVVDGGRSWVQEVAPSTERVTVGRALSNAVIIEDGSASREHCAIERNPEGEGWWLLDLRSRNGTRLNGRYVSRAPLRPGDRIEIGAAVLTFAPPDADLEALARDLVEEQRTAIPPEEGLAIDPLTGLASYPALVRALRQRLAAPDPSLALVKLDVDYLGLLNDMFGMRAGDEVIRAAAAGLREALAGVPGGGVLAAREGGGKLLALLPGLDAAAGAALAEGARERIAATTLVPPLAEATVTLSAGVAAAPEHGEVWDHLLLRAEAALARAKREGRDRVALAEREDAGDSRAGPRPLRDTRTSGLWAASGIWDPKVAVAGGEAREQVLASLALSHPGQALLALVAQALGSDLPLEPLLELILNALVEATEARRAWLLLRDEHGALRLRHALDKSLPGVPAPEAALSQGVVRAALEQRAAVVLGDAQLDPRFRAAESVVAQGLRSVLAAPVFWGEETVGLLYLDHPGQVDRFDREARDLVLAFGRLVAGPIRAKLLHEARAAELERAKAALARSSDSVQRRRLRHARIVGDSTPMHRLFHLIDRVSESHHPVLIHGESGTGKELVAAAVHGNSPRRDGAFVAENCAAFSETLLEGELFGHVKGAFTGADQDRVGLFEAASGGTLFLDEVGEMSPGMQAKLLRVLQEGEVRPVGGRSVRKVDVRLIAASNRDLPAMVREGTFREDLYYRLAVITLEVPPLRERREDIPLLVQHFLARAAAKEGREQPELSRDALQLLVHYDWPGNVRELENEVKKLIALVEDRIEPRHLSPRLLGSGPAGQGADTALGRMAVSDGTDALLLLIERGQALAEVVEDFEREAIGRVLAATEGNRSETARRLGLSRPGLLKKMKRYGIE